MYARDHTTALPYRHTRLRQIFQSRSAGLGGVVYRKTTEVERDIGVDALTAEVRRRGFRLVRTRTHFIIICDAGPLETVV